MSDNAHSIGGSYGLRNEMVTWLIGIGRGDVAALSPTELQTPMEAPKCQKPMVFQREGRDDIDYRCNQTMLYRGDYWLCANCKARMPVKQFEQPTPKLIDWNDGRGAVPFRGGIETLLRLTDKQVDVVYGAPWPGMKPEWRYVVRS